MIGVIASMNNFDSDPQIERKEQGIQTRANMKKLTTQLNLQILATCGCILHNA